MAGVRHEFQRHALDGAVLFFHTPTGTSVRVENAATRGSRRRAPRVAMFGITNACNLRCSFCSRDRHAHSTWTVDSAAELLEGLAVAGTLEVAFGGGEPLAFRGFPELIDRLHEKTALALHVTTNGTLLDRATMQRLAGKLGQVRLSIYDGTPWRPAARSLTSARQKWGANVLVDSTRLATLPALLEELAQAGASDVSILRYVDQDARLQLDASGRARLAAIVAESRVPTRLSVCFGSALDVPRLFDGLGPDGDCGAGLDFVSLTADGHLQACSFQGAGIRVHTAADVLEAWGARRDHLAAPSPRLGCARTEARAAAADSGAPLRVWQAFSGNNSGECIMVATFATPEAARSVLEELLPGYVLGDGYSKPWRELFTRERVAGSMRDVAAPEELISVGRSILARTTSAPEDDFPELRAFAWKRGGTVHPGFIHVHDRAPLSFVVRCHDPADLGRFQHAAREAGATCQGHGTYVIGTIDLDGDDTPLQDTTARLRGLAGTRPLACELLETEQTAATLLEAVKRLGLPRPIHPRLAASFHSHDTARVLTNAEALQALDPTATRVRGLVLFDPVLGKKRLAVLAHRRDAMVTALEGERVLVRAYLGAVQPAPRKGTRAPKVTVDVAALRIDLHARLLAATGEVSLRVDAHRRDQGAHVAIETAHPGAVLEALDAAASKVEASLSLGLGEVDPLGAALARLRAEVDEVARDRGPAESA